MSDTATKRVIAEFARRLHVCGILTHTEEMAYLSVYELLQWGNGLGKPLRARIRARKAEYARYRQLTPPTFIGQAPPPPGESGTDRFGGPAAPLASAAGTIQGIGAAAGVVRGRALVAHSLVDALALQRGDILICRSTDPTWTPLFAIAGGLVTDFGGSLSHAAVVAREYRLPAVVGTHIATQQIVTGQRIEVDGLQGIVRLF
jgi:rifampicin phosphotransferase